MSETNKITAAQLTAAMMNYNSNLDKNHYSLKPATIDSVTETYKKILDYLNRID